MMSESELQQRIMIEAAKHGITLMRNNSGAGTFIDEITGATSHVRFGLGNDSKTHNDKWKSIDLIGIMPLTIPQQIVSWFLHLFGFGVIGVFIAIEVKREGWVFNPKNKREQAQLAFINWVRSKGGVAGFCSSVDSFLGLIGKL